MHYQKNRWFPAASALLFLFGLSPVGFGADSKVSARGTAPGEDVQIPVLGYFARTSPLELRPIVGITGAVILGDPMALPEGVNALALAPGQEYAAAQAGDQGAVGLLPIAGFGVGDLVPIAGATAAPDRIEFSPTAAVMALYSNRQQNIQLIGGLPAAPQVIREVDVSGLSGPPAAFAVSDDGQSLLVAAANGDGSTVTLFPAGGNPRIVAQAGTVSAIRFFPGAGDAVAADSQWNQILLLDSAGAHVVAGEADGVSGPVDVQTSATARHVLVVNPGNQTLLDVDLDLAVTTSVACSFAPAGLRMLSQKSVFLAIDPNGRNAWTFHTDVTPERVSYVPAAAQTEAVSQ